ncbi:PREDICTED: uncharacterized protein LOC108780532 [Cyphomyrmex costatus]|uniref:uncharacterized protein LOC108780532 n=1 Tax=Cyphomyrmex costatus TaxID=456900 RepID=UPI0008523D3F|nr:PREDICTED: uncharacterized protein LOC108780532 [Cyphomyrmex costatus]
MCLAAISPSYAPQLMTTATVFVQNRESNWIKCRALMDTCATASFVSEGLAKRLGIPISACTLPIGAINSMSTTSKGVIRIIVRSLHSEFSKELTCLLIPTISDLVPSEIFPRETLKIPSNIILADPEFHVPRPVDILIGSGPTLSLFSIGQINLSRDGFDLYLQKTRFGWIVAGGGASQSRLKTTTCALINLEQQIANFWTIEEIANNMPRSVEEIDCETHFTDNVIRCNDGRYMVRLPFRKGDERLGESRTAALKRLYSLERKLASDSYLKTAYSQVIQEYLDMKHMSLIDEPFDDGFYMPHHAVIKNSSNTTKVRVVFDASAKASNGLSLNNMLMVGPTIQDPLFAHLLRFRIYKYVLSADIEKMYRQVLVHQDDRIYQRILWRQDGQIKTFQLNTLTFGVSSSPYLAIRTIQRLADDEHDEFPNAAEVLKNHLYVDDLLTGAETVEEARSLRNEIIILLSRGGFNIRQWASNEKRIIEDLSPDAMNANLVLDKTNALKTLGISWSARADMLHYAVRSIDRSGKITKRIVMSEIARIFDPLGILGPVILYAKKLMQDLWRCKVDWDESIPASIHCAWVEFAAQLNLINQLSIHRQILIPNYIDVQIHGFCDASNTGYGACLYLRSNDGDNTHCHLLCAKSRVAPLKTVTTPRLELCGALLLSKLYNEARSMIKLNFSKVFMWSDSTIVLHWLKTSPHLLKPYVSHRVAQIQEITQPLFWRHVSTKDNPADALSRGQLPKDFLNNLSWFSGPSWLMKSESEWPNNCIDLNELPELRKNVCLTTNVPDYSIFQRYSSYSRLLRIMASCLRFRPKNIYRGPLCIKELDETEIRIIKIIQTHSFSCEAKELTHGRSVNKTNIAALNPFLDENGLIRVGGRLKESKLAYAQKHPILIPSRHFLTDLIIRETHEKHFHTGIQTTLYMIRQKFWLLDGRNQVRKIVRSLKAVHLEVVSDLTTDGFLAALRRFVSRRGVPTHIHSDNGTNFVGANNRLKELYSLFNSEEHKNKINQFSLEHRVTWHFIPPIAPHFGGLWESTVKIFKHHFKRVVGDLLFTFEEFNTFVVEIEGILNSRPISSLSSDPNDLLALTPAHFLIGKPLNNLPELDLSSVPANRLSAWQHIRKVRQDFWARWSLEYLNELQVRHKWIKDGENITTGMVVLVKNKGLPCLQWALGKVLEIHPGEDGIPRIVTIKTRTGVMKRSVKCLSPLPIEQ